MKLFNKNIQTRLLTISNYYYIAFLFILLAIWSVVFYVVLKKELHDSTDEVLEYRKKTLIQKMNEDGKVPLLDKYYNFEYVGISHIPANSTDTYQDTLLPKKKHSYDEYRVLKFYSQINGKAYLFTILEPLMERHDMVETITKTIPSLFLIMIVGFVGLNALLNKKLWKPLEKLHVQIQNFRFDNDQKFEFQQTNIKEFNDLQASLKVLKKNNYKVFEQQKQFIENASHEIQTPLSIIQTKLELLFQDELTNRQANILEAAFMATERLSKINETLLLLTKIENQQFYQKSTINVFYLMEDLLAYFEEQIQKYEINVVIDIPNKATLTTNITLFEILLTNLLKNAFTHNKPLGFVTVGFDNQILSVKNTGEPLTVQPEKLFERFYRQSSKSGAGLGLAIVKSICILNCWDIQYHYAEGIHSISINFKNKH